MRYTTKNLKILVNEKLVDEDKYRATIQTSYGPIGLMFFGPNKDEDYWLFRVQVHDDQYIDAFPKFMTIGIGFAFEDDGNTNLPYNCSTNEIFNNIKKNKRYASISDSVCKQAIRMLQKAAEDYKAFERSVEAQEMYQHEPLIVNEEQTDFISYEEFKGNAVIQRLKDKVVFRRNYDGSTFERASFCIYFGKNENGSYKYRVRLYELNQKSACRMAFNTIKILAVSNEKEYKEINRFSCEKGEFVVKKLKYIDNIAIGI